MKRALIVGATSAIALAVARRLAGEGYELLLAGRSRERLEAIATDLQARGAAHTSVHNYDALDEAAAQTLFDSCWSHGLDFLLLAQGTLPDQARVQDDVACSREAFRVNAVSAIELLAVAGGLFERQGSGTIAVLSSVAGDRGRQSNYVYGSAKAALSAYTQGMRNRLHAHGVNVLTVKPGFVESPMTEHIEKGILFVKPDRVAADIVGAISSGKNVLYTPWFWRYILLIVRLIPEGLFKKLSL